MNTETRKFRKTVFKALDTIMDACKLTAKSWDKRGTHIPIKLFAQFVDKAKWHTGVKDPIAMRYEANFNRMLDLLSECLGKSAASFGVDTVPLKVIESVIQKTKNDIDKGIKK